MKFGTEKSVEIAKKGLKGLMKLQQQEFLELQKKKLNMKFAKKVLKHSSSFKANRGPSKHCEFFPYFLHPGKPSAAEVRRQAF